MNVAHLQQHLADLGKFLEAAGATKTVTAPIAEIGRGLAPFRSMPLEAFAAFLARAEEYDRTGVVPAAPAKVGRKPAGGAAVPKKAPADAAQVAEEVRRLYDRAAAPDVTAEHIDAVLARLAPLTKDGLVTVAERLGLPGMKNKAKADIAAAIRSQVMGRKGMSQRTTMTERPEARAGAPAYRGNGYEPAVAE